MGWLREVAAQDAKREKAKSRKAECCALTVRLDPEFRVVCISMGFFTRESVRSTTLVRGNEKFADLAAALKRRGLPFRPDLQYCKAFLTTNSGDVDTVVDNMEEKHFLFTRTEYPRLSGDNFDADRSQCIPDSCETYTEMEGDWKEIKANLCVEYLRENKGLTLPQKWESCRLRFEEVISRGDDPKLEALYIYLGKDASVEAETE